MSRDFLRAQKRSWPRGVKWRWLLPVGEGHECYRCLPSVTPPFRCDFPSFVFSPGSGFAGCRATWRRWGWRSLRRRGTFWRRAFRRTFRRACFRTSLHPKPYGRPLPLAALWIGQALEGKSRRGCSSRYVADVELHRGAKRNNAEGSVDAAVVSCEVAPRIGRARAVCELFARNASRAILRAVSSVCFVGMLLQRSEPDLFLRTVFAAAVVRRFRLRVWLRRRLVRRRLDRCGRRFPRNGSGRYDGNLAAGESTG